MIGVAGVQMMYQHIRTLRLALCCSAILLLTACGGGGGSSEKGNKESDSLKGNLGSLNIKGLPYETETLSGVTDKDGQFRYRDDEMIRFYLGDIEFGTTEAKPSITPFDWLGIEAPQDEIEISGLLKRPMVSSFDLVLNATVLLMSLDVDGQVDNGIDLGRAHQLLAGKEIELASKAKDFYQQPLIISTVNDLTGRSPISFRDAAEKLYSRLQIPVEVKRVSTSRASALNEQDVTTQVQFNEFGEVDFERIVISEEDSPIEIQYQYDHESRIKSVQNSYTQQTELYEYEEGRLSMREISMANSAKVYRENYRYNPQGVLRQMEIDKDGDGTPESSSQFTYSGSREQIKVLERNEHGVQEFVSVREIKQGRVEKLSDDYDGDGQPELEIIYSYDHLGRMTARQIVSLDPDIESGNSTFEYDDQDRLSLYKQDHNQDGVFEYIEAYAYDENDNRTMFKRDLNGDGRWDYVVMSSFDAQGNRLEVQEDSDGNGVIDHHWRAELEDVSLESGWDAILAGL